MKLKSVLNNDARDIQAQNDNYAKLGRVAHSNKSKTTEMKH